jgi:hypothetical protein
VVLKVYKFQICLFTPPLGDFQHANPNRRPIDPGATSAAATGCVNNDVYSGVASVVLSQNPKV